MSLLVTCPTCNGVFKAAESAAGMKARCLKCGGTFRIRGGPAVVEEIVDAEEIPLESDDLLSETLAAEGDRRPCPMCGEPILRSAVKCRYCGEVFDASMAGALKSSTGGAKDPRWRKVLSGLANLYYGVITLLFTLIVVFLLAAVLSALDAGRGGREPPMGFVIVFLVFGVVVLGAVIAMLVGYVRCAHVPPESGARGFAIGSIICMVANVLLSVLGQAAGSPALDALGSFVSLVGWILFILFVRTSATFLGNDELAESAKRFLVWGGVFMASALALGFLAALGKAPALVVAVGACVFIAMVIGFVWYMRLIQGLMKTIDQRLEQG